MTFPVICCIRIITNGVSSHDPERIGWFRLVHGKREAVSCVPIGLQYVERSQIDMPSSLKSNFREMRFVGTDAHITS